MSENRKKKSVIEPNYEDLSDFIRSTSTIHDHLKNLSKAQLGYYPTVIGNDLRQGIEALNKEISYDNLMEKVKQAQDKIKAIHNKMSGTMTDIDSSWPQIRASRKNSRAGQN